MKTLLAAAAVLLAMSGCAAQSKVSAGTLAGSKYVIAAPMNWNGNLLLLAHGFRSPEEPLSVDELRSATPPYRKLVEDGWLIAETSYRRNGVVIRDAAEDLEGLRQHVTAQFGRPKQTFLIGWSMGGAVAAMIAETRGRDYQGVMAIGAALGLQDAENPYRMTYRPQTPLLFLTNQSELKDASAYVKRAESPVPSVLWVVKRNGHCNVNGDETRAALDALVECAWTGRLEGGKDVTVQPPARRSVAVFKDGRAYAKVTRVGSGYGNIYTSYVPADFARLGIAPGAPFEVGRANKCFNVLLGDQYGDVPRGEWVAFFTAEGELVIARNYAHAAPELGCAVGDEIYIAPLKARQLP